MPLKAQAEKQIQSGKTGKEFDLATILEYVTREDTALTKQIPNKHNAPNSTAETLGRRTVFKTLAQAPETPFWLSEIARWTRYYQVGVRQEFFWEYQLPICAKAVGNDRRLQMFSMETAANMMAVLAILGWQEAVRYQGYLTHAALNRGYQAVIQYQEEYRRAQAFMLRLFADWVRDVSHQWPLYAYDEPIYETLLAHWRTPDPQDLVPCLLAACDRHTYSAGKDTLKKFHDFNDNNYLQRVPVEILLLFRLRQWEGLENPILDHPLMAPPFDRLPPQQPIPELDELMQGVLKRAREDWPQYDEVLSLAELRRS